MCRESVPAGSVFAFLAEQRRVLFPPESSADMYAPVNGHPLVPPDLLATVVVLQALHGLSDEEAVAASAVLLPEPYGFFIKHGSAVNIIPVNAADTLPHLILGVGVIAFVLLQPRRRRTSAR